MLWLTPTTLNKIAYAECHHLTADLKATRHFCDQTLVFHIDYSIAKLVNEHMMGYQKFPCKAVCF